MMGSATVPTTSRYCESFTYDILFHHSLRNLSSIDNSARSFVRERPGLFKNAIIFMHLGRTWHTCGVSYSDRPAVQSSQHRWFGRFWNQIRECNFCWICLSDIRNWNRFRRLLMRSIEWPIQNVKWLSRWLSVFSLKSWPSMSSRF